MCEIFARPIRISVMANGVTGAGGAYSAFQLYLVTVSQGDVNP